MTAYLLDARSTAPPPELEGGDPSLNGGAAPSLGDTIATHPADLERLFFAPYEIGYLPRWFAERHLPLRVVTHPRQTNTCFEKAALIGDWDPLNVIKALYFEYGAGQLCAVVVPETGCFVDREVVAELLKVPEDTLRKATRLPTHMTFGTCSPFPVPGDAGVRLHRVLFDAETLRHKAADQTLDDFSFGSDHRMSLQANYADCYNLLRATFPDLVDEAPLLKLSFREVLVRTKGRLKITYEFKSLNYRTAKLLSSIHGHGDLTVINDFVDELDLPDAVERRPAVE